MELQANKNKNPLISEIREQFRGSNCKAVIPISGDKASNLFAALCTEALGPDRVLGVLMPNGYQRNMPDCYQLMEHLHISGMIINIGGAVEPLHRQLSESGIQSTYNLDEQLLPGIRRAVVDAVAQATNGKTVHFREPLSQQAMTELGHALGLPKNLM